MNHIRIYIRKVKNNLRLYGILFAGLSLALAVASFIFFYVSNEKTFNTFTENHNNIYRVLWKSEGENFYRTEVFNPLGNFLKTKSPYIDDYIRYCQQPREFQVNKETISENAKFIDPAFFNYFEFTLILGTVQSFTDTPNGTIISESFANKYFEPGNAVGKILPYSEPFEKKENLVIVGIVKDLPENSTINGDIFINVAEIDKKSTHSNKWVYTDSETYLLIPDKSYAPIVEANLSKLLTAEFNNESWEGVADGLEFKLQKFDEIYLYSDDVRDQTIKGNSDLITILTIVGFLIIGLSFINYFVISSGMFINKSDNISVMRCFGMSNKNIKSMLIREGVLNMLVSIVISAIIFAVLVNVLKRFLEINITFINTGLNYIISYVIFLFTVTILSGFLQHILIRKVIFGKLKFQGLSFKSILMPLQLSIFIILGVALISISKQVSFMKKSDMGYDLDNTIIVNAFDQNQKDFLINEFSRQTYVKSIARGQGIYGERPYLATFTLEGANTEIESIVKLADHKYLETYKIDLIKGRNISETEINFNNPAERSEQITDIVVNEEFARKLGSDNPIGKIVHDNSGQMIGQIVGVFKNLYQSAFYSPVEPMVLGNMPYHSDYIILNIEEGTYQNCLSDFKNYCSQLSIGQYVDLLFTSYSRDEIYAKDIKLNRLLVVSFLVALAIMCLGLFAISLFASIMKTKEIGIRKVNGAKISEILVMLNKDFVKWVVIAFVIATPIAYYTMNKWLENFAYKTTLSWWIFALAGVLALGIALLTVSWQSWRAATRNPVEALRYE